MNPKNHHYIPQSYLKHFAFREKTKKGKHEYYVYVRLAGKEFQTNIRNICSENYFYTIPNIDEKKKTIIEIYYAENIDSLYPKIYDLVTNDSLTEISDHQRIMVLVGCISLYFRTPAFNKILNEHYVQLLKDLHSYFFGYSERSYSYFFGKKIDLKNIDYNQFRRGIVEENKIVFLMDHLKLFNQYVDYRKDDGIGITKNVDDSQFITSDNPVCIRNMYTGEFHNLFDINNIITLPINHKYLLTITPKFDNSLKGTFSRISGNLLDTLISNHSVEQNSEKWIIGTPESIKNHIRDQIIYNEETPENLKMLEDMKERARILNEFDCFRMSQGGLVNDAVILKFLEISEMEVMKDDPNVKRLLDRFREQGLIK